MSYQESNGYCEYCQKQVLIRREGTNHIFHLLMALITLLQRVAVLKEQGDWANIKYGNKKGWVSKNHLISKKNGSIRISQKRSM